jgi:hypothetical protein
MEISFKETEDTGSSSLVGAPIAAMIEGMSDLSRDSVLTDDVF